MTTEQMSYTIRAKRIMSPTPFRDKTSMPSKRNLIVQQFTVKNLALIL